MERDALPNGLMEVLYDRNGDGVPDHATLHQIMWSGWSVQPIAEIEAQARLDGQCVFIVGYDQDRFGCLTQAVSLWGADNPEPYRPRAVAPVEYRNQALMEERPPHPLCGQ